MNAARESLARRWPALTFDLALLAVLLWVVWESTRPTFRGGHLIALVAGFAAALLLLVLVRALLAGQEPGLPIVAEEVAALAGAPAEGAAGASLPAWRHEWLAVGYTVALFALVYVLGTVLGCVAFVFGFLALHRPRGVLRNLMMALAVGALVPYLFGGPVGLHLWEGVIPTLIPGWIGGAPPPPL